MKKLNDSFSGSFFIVEGATHKFCGLNSLQELFQNLHATSAIFSSHGEMKVGCATRCLGYQLKAIDKKQKEEVIQKNLLLKVKGSLITTK